RAGRAALLVLAMARRAFARVKRRVVVGDELDDPRHLVRVDVQQGCLWIERGPSPLPAAVETGKDDRAFERGRREKALRILAEPREYIRMRLRRSRRQHVFRQALA